MKTLLATASAVFLAFPAWASECGARADVLRVLAEKYGETRRSIGLAERGIVEVFASEKTGTWTITGTTPNGITCVISHGVSFEAVTEAEGDDT